MPRLVSTSSSMHSTGSPFAHNIKSGQDLHSNSALHSSSLPLHAQQVLNNIKQITAKDLSINSFLPSAMPPVVTQQRSHSTSNIERDRDKIPLMPAAPTIPQPTLPPPKRDTILSFDDDDDPLSLNFNSSFSSEDNRMASIAPLQVPVLTPSLHSEEVISIPSEDDGHSSPVMVHDDLVQADEHADGPILSEDSNNPPSPPSESSSTTFTINTLPDELATLADSFDLIDSQIT